MAYYTPDRNEYGGEDYSGSIDGILILLAVFFFYIVLSWICKRICKTKISVDRFFKIFTHGPNMALLLFFLYHDSFKSVNAVMGMLGSMIVSTFLFWGVREVFIDTTWSEIEILNTMREKSQKEKECKEDT